MRINDLLVTDSMESLKKTVKTIGVGILIFSSFVMVIKLASVMLKDIKKSGL
ncbi:MAG: hypothetical protein NZ735_02800 [Candidatus Marinimicrobia bacterium]|nr:hypothetical protein [Candidatus Neomarinimicrobiota bacterium]